MLNASIVLYNHTIAEIELLIASLRQSGRVEKIYLIDNSPQKNTEFSKFPVEYIFNNKNLGYGTGHNIAIRKTIEQQVSYHLVVNPDIQFNSIILEELLNFMNQNQDVGHLMPNVLYPNGETQYLCKLLPKPSDLFFRRFLPSKWTKKSNDRFELRRFGYDKVMEVPYLSGCFMLLRTKTLKEVGLFDERFFMYPEDIDLTRRIHQKYKTVFYPHVNIVHHHAHASYQNVKFLGVHLWNLIKYFNKWGWFFDSERKKVNNETLKKLGIGRKVNL
ncbi:MAG: glycosyltransferase family 2 protein [Paludibacteraceae bacterium]